jgi:hypothetical protein
MKIRELCTKFLRKVDRFKIKVMEHSITEQITGLHFIESPKSKIILKTKSETNLHCK